MTTLDQLVTTTRRQLAGVTGRDRANVLYTSIDTDDTDVVVTTAPGTSLHEGTVLEMGYEQMLVLEVVSSTITVIRGWNDTTATTHTSGDVVFIEPRFTRQGILDEIINEIRALPTDLYKPIETSITMGRGVNAVELPGATDVYRILDVQRQGVDGAHFAWHRPDLQLLRNMATADFPSGFAVALPGGATYSSSVAMRLTYAKPLQVGTLTSATDLQADVGTPIGLDDAIEWGAGSRLTVHKESLRADFSRQGQSKSAAEVPPNYLVGLGLRLRGLADARIDQEVTRLLARYPYWGMQ